VVGLRDIVGFSVSSSPNGHESRSTIDRTKRESFPTIIESSDSLAHPLLRESVGSAHLFCVPVVNETNRALERVREKVNHDRKDFLPPLWER